MRSGPRGLRRLAAIPSPGSVPIRLVGWLGAALALTGLVYLLIAGGLAILGLGRLSWAVTLALTLSGAHLMSLAAVGSHVRRTARESLARPMYLVRRAHGFEGDLTVVAAERPVPEATAASRFSVMT